LQGKLYLCIHGHFYQPPRENPWTGEIEKQISASPFHNWNERIYQECYKPNSDAIIIDETGKVLERINNYEYINFNFGPTLLNWIRKKHRQTYAKIIQADRNSIAANNGHGNAIAQAFNHIIMPLADKEDKITQVKWGLADFKFHFGRDAEGMWLPETAVNEETLEVLIKEKIKYIILDTSQAEKCREQGNELWIDVSTGDINPKISYRYFLNEEKHIDIFFYEGLVSRSLAFEDLAYSSERMFTFLDMTKIPNCAEDQLISIATDGETFGHHKHFADRTIAYLLRELAQKNKYNVTNFGGYLASHPPKWEVKIKKGKNGLGTSWSCVHGVGRWYEDCGCHTGGSEEWNQKWRTPLRNALNYLRDELKIIYTETGNKFLKDVSKAKNNYIEIILDDSLKAKEKFFKTNSKKKLTKDEKKITINLLEMQKFSMYMFTSCGWFFSDISGIETIKILEYAKIALEYGQKISGKNLETKFLEILSEAKSNIPEKNTGKEIYQSL
jgi:alpha-amylase/alpha-mannosidase (GH57 family)